MITAPASTTSEAADRDPGEDTLFRVLNNRAKNSRIQYFGAQSPKSLWLCCNATAPLKRLSGLPSPLEAAPTLMSNPGATGAKVWVPPDRDSLRIWKENDNIVAFWT